MCVKSRRMCSFIPFSIPYLGHCGSNSSREFQSLSFLLQLFWENIEASSQLLLCLHLKMSVRGPTNLFLCFHFDVLHKAFSFCFPSIPTCSLIFKEHPGMQPVSRPLCFLGHSKLHCSTASGHMVSIGVKASRHAGFDGITVRLWAGIQSTFSIMCFFFPNWNAGASLNCLQEYPTGRWSKKVRKVPSLILLGIGSTHKCCFCPRIPCSRGLIADANRCHKCQPWDRLINVSYFHFISKNYLGKVAFDNAVASCTILILHTVLFSTPQI